MRKEAKLREMMYARESLFNSFTDTWDFTGIPRDVMVGIDYETLPTTNEPEVLGLCWGPDRATQAVAFDLLQIKEAGKLEAFKKDFYEFLDTVKCLVAHNMSTELVETRKLGYDIDKLYGKFYDTMPMIYVLNSRSKVGLKENIKNFFGDSRQKWIEAFYKSRTEFLAYCADDAFDCLRLYNFLFPMISEKNVEAPYAQEITLVWALLQMRDTGVLMDIPLLRSMYRDVEKEEIDLYKEVIRISGQPDIKINSNQVVKKYLFETLKVPVLAKYKRTRVKFLEDRYFKGGGEISEFIVTDSRGARDYKATLTKVGSGYRVDTILQGKIKVELISISSDKNIIKMIADNPKSPERAIKFCNALLAYRDVAKFKSSQLFDPEIIHGDGRIRTEFVSCGTKDEENTSGGPITSRLSSRHPNLQNISARNEKRKIIRKAFIAPKGKKLIVADWKAAEVRGITHFAQAKNFMKVFSEDGDPHTMTAETLIKMGAVPSDDFKKARNTAKIVNFATPYNISAASLAKKFTPEIKVDEAQKLLNAYFVGNPEIATYLRRAKEFVNDNRYLRLVSGQWVFFNESEYTDNRACNFPIQGLIGCYSKLVICWSYLHYFNTDVKMIMQIHDEMIWECPEEIAEREKQVIEHAMVNLHPMSVPFPADIHICDNWYEGH